MRCPRPCLSFFFFNDTATTEIYTLSLHDALPISPSRGAIPSRALRLPNRLRAGGRGGCRLRRLRPRARLRRSEEHTSELQSPDHLVCRLLLEKKKTEAPDPASPARSRGVVTRHAD